jgi:diguanylate cyclase (GGDEF)-like protein/PAS domain S-box-containing protein
VAEPGEPPETAEVVRRWVARLARTDGVDISPDELEPLVAGVVADAVAKVESARERAVRRFTSLFSAAPIGIALADPDGEIVEVNSALAQFLGHRMDVLRGRKLGDLGFTDRDRENLLAGLQELAVTDVEHNRQRVQLAHSDDAAVWADITLTYLPGDKAPSAFPVLMAVDANEVHALQETLRHQSVHDSLTGLANNARFNTALENALTPAARDQIALVYLDLDGFRVINDGLGPGVGDNVLRSVARKLQHAFTSHQALIARLTGDGFGVLMHGRITSSEVIALVEAAMDDLGEPIYLGEHGIGVSISAGIVVRDVTEGGADDARRAAELALHRAKQAGRAQWMLFDPELDKQDRARYRLGAEIAGALETGQFELLYCPAVSLSRPDEVAAVLTRLRWRHPELGELEPDDFCPIAEITGMTTQIGRWVIAEALAAAARWHQRFGDKAPDISVLLPTRVARDPDLVKLLRRYLDQYDLPAEALRLRMFPATLVDHNGEVLESLEVVAELGAKLVLTVSGSADLELIAATELPVRQTILAGPVIDAFAEGAPSDAAVRHLIHLVTRAQELNLAVGAQGIRSDEHAARLHKCGVTAGHGPFVETVTDAEIDEIIERHSQQPDA